MDKKTIFNILKDALKDYLALYLVKIEEKIIDRVSSVASNILGAIFMVFTFSLFFVFATVSLALFLGDYFNGYHYGFLLISIIYLVTGITLWIFRNALIKKPLARLLLRSLRDEKNYKK